MSVILDALQKARGDKKNKEPQKNSTARVLEPNITSRPMVVRDGGVGRTLLTVFLTAVIVVVLMTVCGVIYYLYNRLNDVEQKAAVVQVGNVQQAAPAAIAPAVVQAVAPTPFPTPLPEADLPVEGIRSTAVQTATVTDANPAVAKKEFTLGSIICENDDCLASINNQTVRTGDVVRGYKVIEINSTGVTLQNGNNEPIVLSLFN